MQIKSVLKSLLISVALFLCASVAHSQTITAVSGTVVDPAGIPYAGATISAKVIPPSGGASPYVTATKGPLIAPITATLNSAGTFLLRLPANASITPASTHWQFTVSITPGVAVPWGTGSQAFRTGLITVSGSTQSLTATLAPLAKSLTVASATGRVYSTLPTAGHGNISGTTMATAPATPLTGTAYTFTGYVSQTIVGQSCGANSTVVLNAIFQDPNAASAQTQAIGTFTVTTNGTIGIVPLTANIYSGKITFVAKPGTAVQFSTTYSAGTSCSPAPTVQVFPILSLD